MASKKLPVFLAACLIAVSGFFLLAMPARSVHDTTPINIFELDGNVADSGLAGDDWSTANFGGLTGTQLAKTGVLADPAPQSIFSGGGSKDDLDLNGALAGAGGWKHKTGQVPDKDDITNAYAVAYNVGGDLVIYAGADRLDNSGDAFMGFWFFQNQIGLGPISGNSGPFTGQHAVGDVLVLANYSGGGTTVNIEVLKWVGSGGNVNGTLQRIGGGSATPATCSSGLANDLFCAITNPDATQTPPWPYANKNGGTNFPTAAFLELGINISKVFSAAGGGAVPCFSSFMAETRSSSSVNAVLKDFALGSFPVCGVAVSKVCKNPLLLADNATIRYTIEGRVENTGFGTLTNVGLSDNPTAETAFERFACDGNLPTGGVVGAFGTGFSLAPLASACYRSTFITTTNGQDDVVTATASAGNATVTAQAGADCPNINLSPLLDVTKTCSTTLAVDSNKLVVQVDVDGSVCNTGDSTLSNVTVTDTDIGANLVNLLGSPQTLAVGACKTFKGSYFPSSAENQLNLGTSTLVPGLAKFSDTVTATATAPLGFQVPVDTATAECTLCPGGVCTSAATGTQTKMFRRTR